MALMAAISGFRWVPTPIVSISGSCVTVSSAAAPMVGTPMSLVRSLRWISMPLSANLEMSCAGTESWSSMTISALVLSLNSAMDHASLSMSSNRAWRMASSMVLPAAIPLVWYLKSW